MSMALSSPSRHYRPRRITLRNRRKVILRGVVEADAAEIVQAFERLSMASRYQRFMQHKRQIDPAALHRGVRPVPGEEFTFVATVPTADGFDIVGAARYVRAAAEDGESGDSCEFAITVAEDWRGTGLAAELMASLIRRARHDGYRRMQGYVLAENASMIALAQKMHFTVHAQADDGTVVRVWRDLRSSPGRPGRAASVRQRSRAP